MALKASRQHGRHRLTPDAGEAEPEHGEAGMKVGQFLKAWREKRDLTVRDAAPQIGISIATLSRIERGGQMDAETQLRLIVFLFGKSPA